MVKKTKSIVRPATAMDSVNIVRLIRSGFEETAVHGVAPMNDQALVEYVTTTLRHCFCVVCEMDGRILGALALVPIKIPWSPLFLMAEAWFAVKAEQRAKGVPEQLLDASERFLDQNKLTVVMGTQIFTSGVFNEVLGRRAGMKPSRMSYVREPQGKAA